MMIYCHKSDSHANSLRGQLHQHIFGHKEYNEAIIKNP